ncbi:BTAD domain-containing putative transcriptional regulator [Actinosynnema sp. NPDC050801]|uniref:AfsR/SARP family transcriptional regulator n=1 Tax=unclassified Actinosynnema TaxID=2637065 RepID=UPI0033CC3F7F
MTKEITAGPTFHLLGPPEARVDGTSVDLGTNREKRVLTPLLLEPGKPMYRDRLLDWGWDDLPDTADQLLHEVMANLRRRFGELGLERVLINKNRLCTLDVPPLSVDVYRFRASVRRAMGLPDAERRPVFEQALLLYRGEPLAGLDGRLVDNAREALWQEHRKARVMLHQAELRVGRHEESLLDLARLGRERPDDSQVAALHMYALYRNGLTAEAVAVYQAHDQALAETDARVPVQLKNVYLRMARGDRDLGPDVHVYLGGKPQAEPSPPRAEDTAQDDASRSRPERLLHARTVTQHAEQIFNEPITTYGVVTFGGKHRHHHQDADGTGTSERS